MDSILVSPSRASLRISFAVVIVSSALALGVIATSATGNTASFDDSAGPRDATTVVSSQNGLLVAYGPDGDVSYHETRYDTYMDVDPVRNRSSTVLVLASEMVRTRACSGTGPCTRSIVDRVNLSTGARERVFDRITPALTATRWHDVDRISPTQLLVGDIARDRVMIVNTTTEVISWEWEALSEYSIESGGRFPEDWTHLNDVERLPDGRIMASIRNMDEVVFIDRERGVVRDWTLGEDGDHDILYEQHNPDYIPADRGGPAVLVSDSENNRVVEYQREGDSWTRTWTYAGLQWPRDADRLPDGTTLVVDSNNHRVLEVDAAGDVVWSVSVNKPYDAERLGTGDESAGGRSATSLGLADKRTDDAAIGGMTSRDRGLGESIWLFVRSLFPSKLVNALLFVAPPWLHAEMLPPLFGLVGSFLLWGVLEVRWRYPDVRLRSPIVRGG